MRTKNLDNIIILSLSNAALHLLSIVYHMIITRLGGAEGMGMLQLVMPFYGLLRAISMSGTTVAVSRLTAESSGRTGAANAVRSAVLLFLTSFVLTALPTYLLSDGIASVLLGDESTAPTMRLMLVCLFFTGFENIFKSYFYGIKRVAAPIISDITEQLVRIISAGYLLSRCAGSISSQVAYLVISAMICSELVSSAVMFMFYKRSMQGVSVQRKMNALPLRAMLGIAVPISAGGLLDSLLGTASSLSLPGRLVASGMTRQASVEALGILNGMVMPVMALPGIFIGALCTISLPSISSGYSSGNITEARRRTVRAFTAAGLLTFPLTGILISLGADICYSIYHQHGIQNYIAPLAISSVFGYFHTVAVCVLSSIGRQKVSNVCSVLGGLAELILIILLAGMPSMGIYGYIAARIICGFVTCSASVLLICSHLALKLSDFKGLLAAVLPALAVTLTAELLFKLTDSLLLSAGLSLGAYLLAVRKVI